MEITVHATTYHCHCNRWSKKHHLIRLRRFRNIAAAIKTRRGCTDCGGRFDAVAMDFDHLPGFDKQFNISNPHPCVFVSEFIAEIEKCHVVCANCHRMRTFSRYDSGRYFEKLDRATRIATEKKQKTAESLWGDRAPQISAAMAKQWGESERKKRVLEFLRGAEGKRKLTKDELSQKWDLIRELESASQ